MTRIIFRPRICIKNSYANLPTHKMTMKKITYARGKVESLLKGFGKLQGPIDGQCVRYE